MPSILWSEPAALSILKSLEAKIKLLEAQKKLVERRDGEVPKAIAVLQKYAKVLTPANGRQIAKILGELDVRGAAGVVKPAKSPEKGRKLGKVAPKFALPTGETWTGRGLTPKVFAAWAKSAEGKAWSAANEGQRFPAASTPKTAANKVKKVTRKSAQKSQNKKPVVKKAAKKLARKPARKTKAG